MPQNKAVILGGQIFVGLSVIRTLGENGIPMAIVEHEGADYKETCGFHSKYIKEKISLPYYRDQPVEFIEGLISYAKEQELPPLLIPCLDAYVEVIDKYMDRLQPYFLMSPIKQGLYTELLDKDTLHDLAKKHNVLTPEIIVYKGEDITDRVVDEIGFPCLVKPVNSQLFVAIFKTKLFKVFNVEQLQDALERCFKAKQEVFVQRLIKGADDQMYTFDAYIDQHGTLTHYTSCQKLRQIPINFGSSVYTKQKYVHELYEIGSKFFKDIEYRGFGEIEFKKDPETGKFYMIEVNVRAGNLESLLHKVGFSTPLLIYRDLTNNPMAPKAITDDTGVHFWHASNDIAAILGYWRTGQISLFTSIKSLLFTRKAYAIWDFKDPKPFFVSLHEFTSGKVSRMLTKKKN